MAQTTHQNKTKLLREELERKIKQRISISGRDSRVNSGKAIALVPNFESVPIGYLIKEAQEDYLVDTRNQYYGYECLTLDELAQLADLIKA